MNNQWIETSGDFYIREVSGNVAVLPSAVYRLNMDKRTGELYLTRTQNKFDFPYKMYGIEDKFINRVVKTYESTTGNLGLLLSGVKGTGRYNLSF